MCPRIKRKCCTSLGHFRFKDGRLVAETNSRERALRLEAKLKGHLPGLIVLEKTLYRQMDDPPRLSPEELEKFRRETDLLDYFDRIQDADPARQPKIDFDKLRRMLGLLPKAN